MIPRLSRSDVFEIIHHVDQFDNQESIVAIEAATGRVISNVGQEIIDGLSGYQFGLLRQTRCKGGSWLDSHWGRCNVLRRTNLVRSK